jgi:hypothetical protein
MKVSLIVYKIIIQIILNTCFFAKRLVLSLNLIIYINYITEYFFTLFS